MKKGFRFVFLIIFSLVVVFPIVSYNSYAVPINVRVFNADYSKVWTGLVDILKTEGESISLLAEGKGLIKTEYRPIQCSELKENVDMPSKGEASGFQRPWLWARYRSECTLKQLPENGIMVKIQIRYEGWNASAGRYVRVISNGEREKALLAKLNERMGSM